jgi:hypothetical protein
VTALHASMVGTVMEKEVNSEGEKDIVRQGLLFNGVLCTGTYKVLSYPFDPLSSPAARVTGSGALIVLGVQCSLQALIQA